MDTGALGYTALGRLSYSVTWSLGYNGSMPEERGGKYGPAAGSVIPRKRRVCICRPIQPGGVGSGARGDATDGAGSK